MKVMIVEDDMLVRLGIKSMIPWAESGLEVVCEARDGVEALDLFSLHTPDIALVDIGLPRMSGLDFIEQAKQIKEEAEFVILTCNKDFEMVRKSLRLGVHDFVTKSTMEIEELSQIIQKLSEKMIKTQQNNPADSSSQKRMMGIQQNALLREWLYGLYTNSENMRQKAAEVGINLPQARYEAWVIQLDTLVRKGQRLFPPDLDKIGYAIKNMAKELYRGQCVGLVDNVKENRWHMLVGNEFGSLDAKTLVEAVDNYLGYKISVGCSPIFMQLNEWPSRDKCAAEMLWLKYYYNEQQIFKFHSCFMNSLTVDILFWKKEVMRNLSLLQLNEVYRLLPELKRKLKAGSLPYPAMLKNMFAEMISYIYTLYEILGLNINPVQTNQEIHFNQVTFSEDMLNLKETIDLLKGSLAENKSANEKKLLMTTVENYIKEHFFEEISLNSIADDLQMSPSYLSRLFKEETGQSFMDRVLQIKVEMAVQMMENGMAITEIAEKLGYLNLSSFTRMFKKVKGVAPSQFVHSHRISADL